VADQTKKDCFSFGFLKLNDEGKTHIEKILSRLTGLPPAKTGFTAYNQDIASVVKTPVRKLP
jgi:hypothetical protein